MPDILKGSLILKQYRNARTELTERIIQNEQWYRMRHTASLSGGRYVPASAWLFNSLAVKHADAMEAMPTPYVSAREPSDTEAAEALSKLKDDEDKDDAEKSAYQSLRNMISADYRPLYKAGDSAERERIKELLLEIHVNGEQLYKKSTIEGWGEED